jgi:hypothetical protein
MSTMKLNEYLIKNRITTEQFARQVKCSFSAVCKWRVGERMPRPKTIARIKRITKDNVTPADWY